MNLSRISNDPDRRPVFSAKALIFLSYSCLLLMRALAISNICFRIDNICLYAPLLPKCIGNISCLSQKTNFADFPASPGKPCGVPFLTRLPGYTATVLNRAGRWLQRCSPHHSTVRIFCPDCAVMETPSFFPVLHCFSLSLQIRFPTDQY